MTTTASGSDSPGHCDAWPYWPRVLFGLGSPAYPGRLPVPGRRPERAPGARNSARGAPATRAHAEAGAVLVKALTLRCVPRVEGFAERSLAAFTRGKEAVTRALAPRHEIGTNSPGEANRRLPSGFSFATRAEAFMRHSAVPSAFRVAPLLAIAFALAGPAAADTGYSNVFTIDLRSGGTCTMTCSATVPSIGQTGSPVAFQAAANASQCSGTPAFSWEFGDGARSTLQNPSHTYSVGVWGWSLTTSVSGVTCTRSGTIRVSPPSTAPPTLFAHGICSDGDTWKELAANLNRASAIRFPTKDLVHLYFDGRYVRDKDPAFEGSYYDPTSQQSTLRSAPFYAIWYADTSGTGDERFYKSRVKNVSIWTLGDQLAHVVAAIRATTVSPSVDIVAHSMGGLVSRVYIENLGIVPYQPGSVRRLITLDTPHGGFYKPLADALASVATDLCNRGGAAACLVVALQSCAFSDSVQKNEMDSSQGSLLLDRLNHADIPEDVFVVSVVNEGGVAMEALFLPKSDGVVTTVSQSLKEVISALDPDGRPHYLCAKNILTSKWYSFAPIEVHSGVVDTKVTAQIVALVLAGTTQKEQGCQSLRGGTTTSVTAPSGSTRSAPRATFTFGSWFSGGSNALSSGYCTADVIVRGPDGAELDRRTVSAEGTQTVQFTPVEVSGWTLEIVPTCDVSVSVDVDEQSGLAFGDARTIQVVPVVLDIKSGTAHYTTELTFSNQGTTAAIATMQFTPSGGQAMTRISRLVEAGSQVMEPNITSYLRSLGVSLPADGGSVGTLLVEWDGLSDAGAASVLARTTSATTVPQPVGAAGLAYPGLRATELLSGSATLHGLRQDSNDRSNVAVLSTSSEPVTVRVVAYSGDGSGYSAVVRQAETLAPFGWIQYSRVLEGTGITQGWVSVQKTGGSGSFSTYGVINDNATNDGSFVLPTAGTISGSRVTVPVLVETSAFRSELVLANRGSSIATLTLGYVERLAPALGSGGTATVQLRPREQLVIPDAIQYLRNRGMAIGAMGAGSYAGALRVSVSGVGLSEVFAGARTASPSPAGGQFGLFTPGVYESETAGAEAYVFGLRADATSRSNVAIVNAGGDGDGSVRLEVQVYDGDRGGAAAGSPRVIWLSPGQWEQITGILGGVAVQNGWVRVRRTDGTAGWIAYGVINDGGQPGERTGDGAYVPMIAATRVNCALPLEPPVLAAQRSSPTTIDLNWTAVSGATAYTVYRGTTVVYEGTALFARVSGLSPDTTYCFTIIAGNACGFGPTSSSFCVKPIEKENLLVNSAFDENLYYWNNCNNGCEFIRSSWSSQDAAGSSRSGSARVINVHSLANGGGNGLTQCIPISGGREHEISAKAFIPAGQTRTGVATVNVFWTTDRGCTVFYQDGNRGAWASFSGEMNSWLSTTATVDGTAPGDARGALFTLFLVKDQPDGAFEVRFDDVAFREK